jgi:C-terminal processing protease CtpA/Prc
LWYFRLGINSQSYRNFASADGVPLVPVTFHFATRGANRDDCEEGFTKEQAEQVFDTVWESYDREYAMFTIRPEVDWAKLRDEYRPRALAAGTSYGLALTLAQMLANLRDLHIWVTVDDESVPVFNRHREANANPRAFTRLIGELSTTPSGLRWGVTDKKVGFVFIPEWSGDGMPDEFDDVLEQMRDTRGLIIDARLNGGGSEPLARDVAGRFADDEYVYAYSQVRKGPQHDDLTTKRSRRFGPRGPWRYDRPVIVLTGQKSMSSNESFIAMMVECPQVVTMGDRTCGSSGNPRMLDLPAGITVSLPQWIDILIDGEPLDERGVEPHMMFEGKPEAFEGEHDDLLDAAIDRMNLKELPEEPMGN